MKPSSPGRKPVSRAKAKNAAMLNLLATPGLGSLLCGRWIAGIGQLALAFAGFVIFCVPSAMMVAQYYRLVFGDAPSPTIDWVRFLTVTGIGIGFFMLAWLWSAVTSLSLLREASADSLQSLKNFASPPMPKLDAAQIVLAGATVPNWSRQGDAISRTFQFKDFPAALKFVNAVAGLAEQAWHHPDIDIRWNKVTLALTTHDAGGLTQKDFDLARQFDQLSLR
jgi:4a-hydroxytetrahydrobiopterin dehydratase